MEKETKAQRVERIKLEKDGLDVLKDIHRYAASGESVDPEDIDRFKWYGLYTQNQLLQGEEDDTLYFMLRIKMESGELSLAQIEAVGRIAKQYARDTADFTTRQDIQFHWIQVKDLPDIFARLSAVGISTQFAAGDCPRNVVCCPVNGIDAEQTADVTGVIRAINDEFRANRNFSNLPRKFKVGVCGCSKHCMSHEIQDLSFTATEIDGNLLLNVTVGGGLGNNKRIATHIGYTAPENAVAVSRAVTKLFRDHGNRENRSKARLGHLIEQWGVEKFVDELHNELGFSLEKGAQPTYTPYAKRTHFGLHKSTVKGKSYIGCAVDGGHIGGSGLLALAKVLRDHNTTTIRATTTQNFVVLDAPDREALSLIDALEDLGFSTYPSVFKARTLSCTGLNFCKFAVSETKGVAKEIVKHLQQKFPDFSEPLSISVNGCPNSCSHPHIVDIGLMGCKVKDGEERVNGFELIFNGHLEGDKSHFGVKTGIKVTSKDAPAAIERLISEYQASNSHDFRSFLKEKIDE